MARVLIAGCGDVGSLLGSELVAAGHQVWGLKRNPVNLPAGLSPLAADLTQPESLRNLPSQLDFVFYTAAAGGFNEQRYRAAYVEGVENLLAALQRSDQILRRLFFTSSTSVYAQSGGEWVDENSPAEAAGFSGQALREGEALVWHSSFAATVIRFGGIYGPGRTRLIDGLREGSATCVEQPPLYTNRIHREDCAAALLHLMSLPDPQTLYLGVDDDPAPQCQVLRWLAARLGVAGPRVVASKEGMRALRANKRCRNTRLRACGFQFRYPSFREGYGAMLAAV